ncbi:sugar kinase [Pseudonocardia sp. GCM10023141]|uniref:sugar kinase n=1 Tax=Pseudonocardia sp. GCM10023141 TaxID=3252653 RepID=UPI0036074DCA
MEWPNPYVACLGEALVLLPAVPAESDTAPTDLTGALPAGAELNVAAGLSAAGLRTAWLGRVGNDPYGAFLLSEMRARGIDVGGVEIDEHRPTGSYAKEPGIGPDGEPKTRMHYRRAGSAASAMGPEFLEVPEVLERIRAARYVHFSGITAALSPSCAELMRQLVMGERVSSLCFDVNWREQMWPDGDPAPVIELAGVSDIVLVGADEAERVFGVGDVEALRRFLPGPELIVVKDGATMALAIDRKGQITRQPALKVDVVEPVGAGDAFAAGFLAGLVREEPVQRCLRRGHLSAAAVLTVEGDSAPALDDMLLELRAGEWFRVRVGSGGKVTMT